MASEIEPAKLLLPYLQRADELQKHEPLVAYYCRLYAMERGLRIPQNERTKTTNALLISLMNQLEKDKKSLNLGPDDQLHVEGFALNVFSKADKQDRAGRADLNTAKTFYAASLFFDTLNQFGEVQSDLEQKQKYAAWKAADIRKALKEGRKPQAGPPGGDKDLSLPSNDEYDLDSSNTDEAIRPDSSRMDHSTTTVPDSDSSPQQYDKADLKPNPSRITRSSSSNISSPPHYPTDDYPSNSFHQPPPSNGSEHSIHPQSYHHQPYHPEAQQQHSPQHYPSQNVNSSYSFPNFRSYPSFTESSLPTAPSHYPSYHQHSDDSYESYPNLPPSAMARSPSRAPYVSIARNGSVSEPPSTTAPEYEYDSNYQPPPEQIAEAQKAARFAVGALAFDDVFVAVEHLKKSLELLTKPSAGL